MTLGNFLKGKWETTKAVLMLNILKKFLRLCQQVNDADRQISKIFHLKGFYISSDGGWSKIKRCQLSGRKTLRNLDKIIKVHWHYTDNKGIVYIDNALLYTVITNGCETLIIRNKENIFLWFTENRLGHKKASFSTR